MRCAFSTTRFAAVIAALPPSDMLRLANGRSLSQTAWYRHVDDVVDGQVRYARESRSQRLDGPALVDNERELQKDGEQIDALIVVIPSTFDVVQVQAHVVVQVRLVELNGLRTALEFRVLLATDVDFLTSPDSYLANLRFVFEPRY